MCLWAFFSMNLMMSPAMSRLVAASMPSSPGEEFTSTLTIPGPRHYQVWYMPIRDAAGQPNGTYGLALDVTAERERLAQLQAEKAK